MSIFIFSYDKSMWDRINTYKRCAIHVAGMEDKIDFEVLTDISTMKNPIMKT